MKILIFGDVVGKPGRMGVARVLPMWRKQYAPDLVLANVENLAHGKGVTPNTMAEMDLLGIDVYTSGNHVFDQRELSTQCFEARENLIRPANYMGTWPGQGWVRISRNLNSLSLRAPTIGEGRGNLSSTSAIDSVDHHVVAEPRSRDDNKVNFLVINLNGKVFFDEEKFGGIKNPFWEANEIIRGVAREDDIILVDFHAEATSEKIALGLHLDGYAHFVYGTHSHVPTADLRTLPRGTGFVTDIGMSGPLNSVIGAKAEVALESYLEPQKKFKMVVEENGPIVVRAILIEMSTNGKIESLVRLEETIA